jgi:hypothetical protein
LEDDVSRRPVAGGGDRGGGGGDGVGEATTVAPAVLVTLVFELAAAFTTAAELPTGTIKVSVIRVVTVPSIREATVAPVLALVDWAMAVVEAEKAASMLILSAFWAVASYGSCVWLIAVANQGTRLGFESS